MATTEMSARSGEIALADKEQEMSRIINQAEDLIDCIEDAIRAIEILTKGKTTPRDTIRKLKQVVDHARHGKPGTNDDPGYLGLSNAQKTIEELKGGLRIIHNDRSRMIEGSQETKTRESNDATID